MFPGFFKSVSKLAPFLTSSDVRPSAALQNQPSSLPIAPSAMDFRIRIDPALPRFNEHCDELRKGASKSHSKKIFIILQTGFLFFLMGCSGLEKSEQDKIRDSNAKGEYIYRHHDEVCYPVPTPRPREREAYPWETSDKK